MEDSAAAPAETTLKPDPFWSAQHTTKSRGWRDWIAPVFLFSATIFTTLYFGGRMEWGGGTIPERLRGGVSFAIPLMSILLAHEFGHYFTAMAHGVPASPPYFLPLPMPFVGTLGAVIRMRGSIPTRQALVDIGASGPIAGFVVAVPFLVWGLLHSHLAPAQVLLSGWSLPPHTPLTFALGWINGDRTYDVDPTSLLEGHSLLYAALVRLVLGPMPQGYDVYIHPTAFAAWFGLFVTALNLLPVGQFDGGHVLYAVFGDRAKVMGTWILRGLVVLGLVAWAGWLLWALIGWKVVRTSHPPVQNQNEPLDAFRYGVAWISLAIFVLTFLPVPLAVY